MSVVGRGSESYDVIDFLIGSMNTAVVAEINEESQGVGWAKGCSHTQREEAPRWSWGQPLAPHREEQRGCHLLRLDAGQLRNCWNEEREFIFPGLGPKEASTQTEFSLSSAVNIASTGRGSWSNTLQEGLIR